MDIVERLRRYDIENDDARPYYELMGEAADEIERLRAALNRIDKATSYDTRDDLIGIARRALEGK